MLNKSREGVAYTLVDMESGISDIVVDNFCAFKQVVIPFNNRTKDLRFSFWTIKPPFVICRIFNFCNS
jgi:hypothetical protein